MKEQRQSHRLVPSLSIVTQSICHSVRFRPRASWDVASGALDSTLVMWYAVTHSSSSSSSRIISHNGNPLLKAGCLTGRRSLDARDFLAPLGHRILPGKFLNRKLSCFFQSLASQGLQYGQSPSKARFRRRRLRGPLVPIEGFQLL